MKSNLKVSLVFFLVFLLQSTIASGISMLNDSTMVVEIKQTISDGVNDAEERLDGSMYLNSSDIELVEDEGQNQIVGLRFTNLPIENGAQIVEAYLHFTSDEETSSGLSELTISAEATDNSVTYEEENNNLSSRSLSSAQVTWQPANWPVISEKGELQKTPDLKALIQETIDRPGWLTGNSISFIITGTGSRIAASYELDANQAAELVVKIAYPLPSAVLENIYLNELMSSNSLVADEYEETDDWIEIYNGNNSPIFLGGLYLTDDINNLQKWQISSTNLIQANGYSLYWADGEPEQGGSHANFKLKSSGEFLALVQNLNGNLHIIDSITFPEIPVNISYGRLEDGHSNWVFFGEYSPNSSNNGHLLYFEEAVQFSRSGGYYSSSITTEMLVSDPSASVYYTTDGSIPTLHDNLYTSAVSVNQTTNILARAFKPGYISNQITSEFYLVNEPSEIAVLNVQSNPDNFWDNETGIYVAGTNGTTSYCSDAKNWNQDWERPCELTFYEPDGNLGFKVNAGMKIGGACSRNLKMKSLNFFLRNNNYGDEKIEYKVFSNENISEFRRLKIRNSGGDWIEMLFRDGMNSLLLNNTVDLYLMAYRPVRVYLNGEYWGIYGLREMFNKYYTESHHEADPDNVDILGDPYGPNALLREGDFNRYNEMDNFISGNSLNTTVNYEKMHEFIDMQQYLNYHIAQIYFASYDWPGNNVRVWRDKDGGKFRWMLFDTDASTGWVYWGPEISHATHNTITHMLNDQAIGGVPGFTEWPNGPESTFLFRKLIENNEFKGEFIQRTCSFSNIIFAPERVMPKVDSIESLLRPEMHRHITEWLGRSSDFGNHDPSGGSVAQWSEYVDNYKTFFRDRGSNILLHLENSLGAYGRFNLAFNLDESSNGNILIHQNEMPVPYNYNGVYFKDIPIKIKALPDEGYHFSHWEETGSTNNEMILVGTEDRTLTPIFEEGTLNTEIAHLLQGISVYTNSVEDILYINTGNQNSEILNLRLYNVMGKEVINHKLFGNTRYEVSIVDLYPGVYILKLRDSNQRVFTQKIVIK